MRKSSLVKLFAAVLFAAFMMLFASAAAYAEEAGEGAENIDTEVPEGDSDADMLPEGDADAEPVVDNGIPVIYLNIDESRGTIEDMLDSVDHNVYCYGSITIIVPEGFHYVDFPDLNCESFEGLEMSIRGRGNSTWHEEKKPFKIKLDKKADLFGLGKNKHWVLVANAMDASLLKDRISAWLGDEMGFAFTPRGVPVDLVMTGENFGTQYLGSYYFSENVRVDDNRLNIAELDADDTDPQMITGGYLLQNSYQVREGSPDKFTTSRGAKWATHTPSFDTEEEGMLRDVQGVSLRGDASGEDAEEDAFTGCELGDAYNNPVQQQYIQAFMQMAEDVLYEGGTAYRELFDVESAAKYWLVQEVSKNGDAYATGSTYIYKDRDVNGQVSKLYWGPLWDFDFAWKNILVTGFEYGHEWIKPMLCDREEGGFVQELHKQWPAMKAALMKLTEAGGIIDQYYEETKLSAEQDRLLYHPDMEATYFEDVEKLKTWINNRVAWVDDNLSMVDDMVHQITFMVDDEVYKRDYYGPNERIYGTEAYPEKEGYTFLGWADESGSIISSETDVLNDMILTAMYVSDSEATHGADIAFSKNCDIMQHNVHIFMYQIPYVVIPTDAQEQAVQWSSSDESYATVDEYGMVTYNGPGEVTLTAKLKYGAAREYTLTITEDPLPVPASVYPDMDEICMAPGDQAVCSISTDPTPAKINRYLYESEDPDVVTVGECGVLTAVGLGETRVHIFTTSYTDSDDIILEAVVKVAVTEDGEPEEDKSTDEGDESEEASEGEDGEPEEDESADEDGEPEEESADNDGESEEEESAYEGDESEEDSEGEDGETEEEEPEEGASAEESAEGEDPGTTEDEEDKAAETSEEGEDRASEASENEGTETQEDEGGVISEDESTEAEVSQEDPEQTEDTQKEQSTPLLNGTAPGNAFDGGRGTLLSKTINRMLSKAINYLKGR